MRLISYDLGELQTDKFKIAVMSISLLTQLNRETAAMNALIPFVLRRGTAHYGDMEKISNRLDELYYSTLDPIVRRIGEIQCVGLLASYPEDDYLPEGETVAKDAIGLMCEMLINPLTRGGLLMRSYVESERDKLADTIRSRINEKGSYAVSRCIEEMCCFEDFSVGRYGSAEDCESIRYKKLTQQYHKLLETSPVEIFYCGNDSCKRIAGMLKDALCTMPRGEIDYEIGTDVRMNAVEDEPRIYTETLDVTQGRLVIGFRLGECMEDPDKAPDELTRIERERRLRFYLRCGLLDLPFTLRGNGMAFAVMSNTDTIGPEKCRAVIEGIMGVPVDNLEIVPK